MAFYYEETKISEKGQKTIKAIVGSEFDFKNFSLKGVILSRYGSVKNLTEKAKLGQDGQAQADLALIYKDGLPELNIKKDLDTAIYWFETAVKNDSWPCSPLHLSRTLGSLYLLKETIPHKRRALELFMQAAQLGDRVAEINLAESYRCGVEGVVQEDIEEAFKWYRRAAEEEPRDDDQGDNPDLNLAAGFVSGMMRSMEVDSKFTALKMLYQNYMDGDCPEGEPQPVKALYYLKKAAELGDPEAQKDLGLAYLTGESGHPKDLDKAKRWLGKAAQNGEQQAKQTLKKLDDLNDVVTTTKPESVHPESMKNTVQQYLDIKKIRMKQEEMHPCLVKNSTIFKESTFTQFPESPTAQRYLKAFRLVRKGVGKLQSSSFADPEGITLIAQGTLYENSIIQSFPEIRMHLRIIFGLIRQQLRVNDTFFEGLFLIIHLQTQQKLSVDSYKLDINKTMSLKNLILLIQKAESDKPPKEDPYNFEEDYSSWLHVLYYDLGCYYIVTQCFKDGAEAFTNSLKCCPTFFEAKVFLGYCLMNMVITKDSQPNADEELLESLKPPKNQQIPIKSEYLTWTDDQLRDKAKQLFMEYLQEAPECDKKYPHCHYHLAVLHYIESDLQAAIKWKEKGEDAEEKRLPFMEPVDVSSKKMLDILDIYPISKKKCSNKQCPNKETQRLTLKSCPCHTAAYCSRKCQAADWKEHKKTCTHKMKKGTK